MSSPATQQSMLGLDLSLTDRNDAQAKIAKACAKVWFEINSSGLHNFGDCSGFVKAVQKELWVLPFRGDANSIFEELEQRSDWQIIGTGSHAASLAGHAANLGSLVIGVWKNPAGRGHVAIITTYLELLGQKPEQKAIGAWGKYKSVGHLLERLSQSFGTGKHTSIRYAKCVMPVF